jgi:hypothetical protein
MKKNVVQGSLLTLFVLASSFSWASKKQETPSGPVPGRAGMVDSGSFGLFKAGRRVATETFRIEQSADSSMTTSEFKLDDGSSSQASELLLSSMGELRKYSWHEPKAGSQTTITPGEEILMEHIVDDQQKPHDVPFILPPSTSVLDDYFFIHRELLLWKYIASSCPNLADCKLTKTSIGVINPHQAVSLSVSVEFVGMEKVTIRGAEQQLRRFNLTSEDGSWMLWMNDQFKLVRIVVAGEDTEIVRD